MAMRILEVMKNDAAVFKSRLPIVNSRRIQCPLFPFSHPYLPRRVDPWRASTLATRLGDRSRVIHRKVNPKIPDSGEAANAQAVYS